MKSLTTKKHEMLHHKEILHHKGHKEKNRRQKNDE